MTTIPEPVAWEGWWLHHGQHNYRAKPLSPERVKELMKLAFEVGREATLSHQAEPVQEQAEPVPGAWVASPDGRVIYDDVSADDGLLRVSGDFENDEQRIRYAQRIVDALNAAPPKAEPVQEPVAKCIDDICSEHLGRVEAFDHLPKGTLLYTIFPRRTMVPLTEEEIDAEWHELDGRASALFKRVIRKFARAVEKASWEKNNGQA